MKRIFLTGYSLFILGLSAFATEKTDEAKAAYQSAKTELMAMLNGQQAPSYERAIFLMENAYWDNGLDYHKYTEFIDWHTKNIGLLLSINKSRFEDNYSPSPLQAAMQSKESREQALEKLATNWAIYTYMKGGSIPIKENGNPNLIVDRQFSYSYNDPMGTQDWYNTFVTHLLNTGNGNCFALASLYKIFSDRLQANAVLSTAPSHIFIRHANEKDLLYNIELSNGSFPGSGTIETLTYTTNDATNNNIAMRDLDDKQAIALCLVYLAKGYEQKFGADNEAFLAECAEQALTFDDKSLNAMLLQFELLQRKVLAKSASPNTLKADKDFLALEQLTNKLYQLGYREMPLDMKNKLIQGWMRDTSMILVGHDYNPPALNHAGVTNTPYASLSWGMFDEEIPNKPFEQYGSTVINTQTGKIEKFVKAYFLYNNYDFDPVVFAMNVDPLAHKYPSMSPYAFVANNPIRCMDPDGRELVLVGYASDLDGFKTAISKASQGQIKLEIAENGVASLTIVGNEKLSEKNQQFYNTLNEVMTNKKATYVQVLGDEGKNRKIAFLGGYQNIKHPDVPQAYGSLDYQDMQGVETKTNGELSVLGFVGHEVWENYEKQVLRPNTSFKKAHGSSINKQSKIDNVSNLSLRGDLTEGSDGSVNGNVEINYTNKEGEQKTHSIIVTEGNPAP